MGKGGICFFTTIVLGAVGYFFGSYFDIGWYAGIILAIATVGAFMVSQIVFEEEKKVMSQAKICFVVTLFMGAVGCFAGSLLKLGAYPGIILAIATAAAFVVTELE